MGMFDEITVKKENTSKTSLYDEIVQKKKKKNKLEEASKKMENSWLGKQIGSLSKKAENYKFGDITKGVINESEALRDGYQPGDIAKTAGSTILSGIQNFGEGAIRGIEQMGEGIANLTYGGINDNLEYTIGHDILGLDQYKNISRKDFLKQRGEITKRNIANDNTTGIMEVLGKDEDYKNLVEANSLIKTENLGGQAAQEIGRQALNIVIADKMMGGSGLPSLSGTGTATKVGNAVIDVANKGLYSLPLSVGAYGSGVQEAYQNGATWEQANRYGILNSATETVTEWITGGIPGMSGTKGGGLDKLAEKIIGEPLEESSSTLAKALLKSGYKLAGESTEEVLSDVINPYLKQYTYAYNSDKDALGNFKEATENLPSMEDLLQTIIVTCLTTGILEAPSNISDISQSVGKKGTNIDTTGITHTNNILNTQNNNINAPNLEETAQDNINIPVQEKVAENAIKLPTRNVQEASTNENINLPSINTDENITENLEKYNQKQKELKQQQLQQEMNKKIDELSKKIKVQEENTKGIPFNTLIGYGNDTALVQVNGTIQNINGVDVGIYKDSNGQWHVVDLQSNFSFDRGSYSTKKAALENATNVIDNFDLNQLRQNSEERKSKAIDLTPKPKIENKNDYKGSHQIENAKRLVDLNINDIQNKVEELNGYLTQQDQADLRKLKSIFNHPEEDIKIYRASPVNELNNGDWVTTDKAYAKNVADNNGGKVYEYTVKPNQLYYSDNIRDLPSLHRLSSFQCVENQPNIPTAQVNKVNLPTVEKKGNIPINKEVLNKYNNTNEMMNSEVNNYDGKVDVKDSSQIEELKNVDLKNMNQTSIYHLATDIFDKYNNTNTFENDGNKIIVSHADIKESIKNIYNGNQIKYLKEHLQAFSDLGDIIESATLASQNIETKKDVQKSHQNNTIWSYYLNGLKINGDTYLFEFDVVSRENGENHYRVQRIQKADTSTGNTVNNSITPDSEASASVNNNTTNTEKSQISLPKQKEINLPKNPTKESSYEVEPKKKTQKVARQELLEDMNVKVEDIAKGKDISSINYQITDPIRVNEKVFGAEIGQKINDATINQTKHNEAERNRFLNKERQEIKDLGIKPRSKESAAVQKYGEKQYLNDNGELVKYGDKELAAEFPNVETQNKIKHAAEVLRNKYDRYIEDINNVITDLGYDPIPKRPDYMRHFQEINDKLSEWGIPLNPTSMNENNIPTDINGLTDQFKPGKNWFASAMQRKGMKTTYDAITGIDGYLEGASNLIYHTGDIQRYRALSKLIRDTYGQTHGMDNIDPSTETGQQRLQDIFDNKLSKYAAWIDEQANSLAGKKSKIDRGAEEVLGRKIYSVLEAAKKQVGSNMTGFNVRSALTNFASAVQGASKTQKVAFLKGTISTMQNIIHDDGLINKSDFLTSRLKNSDQLSKKLWQKASNAGQIFMTGTDYFTANQIWRSKYYENLSKGMNENQAIKNADDFAARIMGDRSKGSTAAIFNSKTLGLLTQFQLEVNNQWQSIIHDNKMDLKTGNKSGATVMFQLGQLFAMSYFFNSFMRSLTGSDVMIDPIDMLLKIIGAGDDDDDKTIEQRAEEVFGDLINDLPFVSFWSGGRIPISEAFKGGETALKKLTGQKDKYGNDIKWEDVKDDLIESGFYWLLPTGYGQIKKTTKGLSMYDTKLPMPGSYTKSGNLRFRADESAGGKIKSALFGQYSSKEAQKYIDSGYQAISKSRLDELKELDMSASEYRKYRKNLNNAGTKNADKIDYIANSNYSDEQKNIMAKNVLEKDFDIDKYKKYSSYEEYDYATKYPDKYSVIKQIAPYDKYSTYKDKITEIRNNTINDKQETIKYINSLPLSIPKKAMFIKQYYKSFNQYDKQIIEYINKQSLTRKEKEQILTDLGFTVKNGRVY